MARTRRSYALACRLAAGLVVLACAGVRPAAAQDPGWTVDPAAFAEQMTLTGQLVLGGAVSADPADRVAAFVGGEVRGVAAVQPSGFVVLTVYADAAGERLAFQAYDADADADGAVTALVGAFDFVVGCQQGTPSRPYVFADAWPEGSTWAPPAAGAFGETMQVTATLEGVAATRVAAFVGAELRGLAEGDLTGPFALTVFDEALPADCPLVVFLAYGDAPPAQPLTPALRFASGTVGTASAPFVLTPGDPLPVELAAFTALADGASVHLAWTTASETGNAGFVVEHRANGGPWAEAGFVPGAGTSTAERAYAHRINGLPPGTHRFRLRQVDYDGTLTYSGTLEVALGLPEAYRLSPAYPNPFGAETAFMLQVRRAQPVRVTVHDLLGREVAVLHDGPLGPDQAHRFTVDGRSWPAGAYLYRAEGPGFHAARLVVLSR